MRCKPVIMKFAPQLGLQFSLW